MGRLTEGKRGSVEAEGYFHPDLNCNGAPFLRGGLEPPVADRIDYLLVKTVSEELFHLHQRHFAFRINNDLHHGGTLVLRLASRIAVFGMKGIKGLPGFYPPPTLKATGWRSPSLAFVPGSPEFSWRLMKMST